VLVVARSEVTGYGHLKVQGQARHAHRVSYEMLVGPIPVGLTLDHVCREKSCVRPEHLEAVPLRENIHRSGGRAALNVRKTHRLRGHPFSGDNQRIARDGGRVCRACARGWGKKKTAVA
jgi:HNH endonuclease